MLNWDYFFICIYLKINVLNSFQLRALNSRFCGDRSTSPCRAWHRSAPLHPKGSCSEAFPCVIYLVSNLISLLMPGDPLEEERLILPGVPKGSPHWDSTSSTDFWLILSDFCQCFHTAAGALTLKEWSRRKMILKCAFKTQICDPRWILVIPDALW